MRKAELTYSSYLKVPDLLALQQPHSVPLQHDEMLFIVIHQVYELWFKQVLFEIDKVKTDFSEGRMFDAIATLKRVRTIVKTLVGQLDVLETMTPLSFGAFRDRLETASGFQSVQFRELEFVLGHKRSETLAHHAGDPAALARLERRLDERSLVDHFYDFLARRGVEIPDALRRKPPREPNGADATVQRGLLRLYREEPDAAILLELMTDLDEGLQEWRYRHVIVVQRTIGNKQGTGGSYGVEFLKTTLFKPVFPDLWAIRHEL
jgi:tryptophan 2,3-dioxygenase